MALSSGSKKSTQSDLDSDSDDEVRDGLPFLRQANERLGLLLDNRDDMLREAKKMRKELRASLLMKLNVLIVLFSLLILVCLRKSMPSSVRN
jgi:hypothetical protein